MDHVIEHETIHKSHKSVSRGTIVIFGLAIGVERSEDETGV